MIRFDKKYKALFILLGSLIWAAALMLVYVRSNQTQLGYKLHQLRIQQERLLERNLRLRSEIASLYNLEKSRIFAQTHGFIFHDPSLIQTIERGQSQ